jgi:hypothetical protein
MLSLERLEERRLLAGNVKIELYGAYTLNSYAGVGFQENEVATMQAQVDGQADTNEGDFQAQIQWGDGGSSAGDLVYQGTSGSWANYLIKGSHVYPSTGTNIPIDVTVTGPDSTSVSFYPNDLDSADVAAMPSGIPGTQPSAGTKAMAPADVKLEIYGAYTLDSYAGVGFQENEVATMQAQVNGQADETLSDFHAQINWGDSASWYSADLVYLGTSGNWADYLIKGSHVYQKPNTDIPIVVYATGPDGTSTAFYPNDIDSANVVAMPSGIAGAQPSAAANPAAPANVKLQIYGAYTLTSYAGVGFQENEVATMQAQVDGQPDETLSDLHAQINWGDSAAWDSADLVYMGTSGNWADYLIKGSHVYQKAKTNIPIVVYTTGPDGTSTAFSPNDIDSADVTAMPSGIPGTQPALGATTMPPADVKLELYGAYTINSYAGAGFQNQEVATMQAQVNGQPDTSLADFGAQINWGDSAAWTQGNLVYQGTSGNWADYIIKGSHVYQKTGTNIPIVVYATGPDGTSTAFYPNDIDSADVTANPNAISVGALSPTQWQVNEPNYDGTIPVKGGTGTYTNLQVSGLPSGLAATVESSTVTVNGNPQLSGTIFIDGTPTEAGIFTVGVSLQDSSGDGFGGIAAAFGAPRAAALLQAASSGSKQFQLVITASLGRLNPDQWTVNQFYRGTTQVPGLNGIAANAIVTGLPPDLKSSQSGNDIIISGIPTQVGKFDKIDVSIPIGTGTTDYGNYTLTINPAVNMGGLNPNRANQNQLYSGKITVSGGTGGYSNPQVIGANWLVPTVNGSTITLSGTPPQSGTVDFKVTVQDRAGAKGSASYQLAVTAAPTLGGLAPTQGTVSQQYVGKIQVSGGSGRYQQPTVTGLPKGLGAKLAGDTIVISGIPTQAGPFKNIKVSLRDSKGTLAQRTYILTISPAPAASVTITAPATVTEGTPFSITITVKDKYGNGVPGPVTLNLEGNSLMDAEDIAPRSVSVVNKNGTATVTVTLTAESWAMRIRATAGGVMGTSRAITVLPPTLQWPARYANFGGTGLSVPTPAQIQQCGGALNGAPNPGVLWIVNGSDPGSSGIPAAQMCFQFAFGLENFARFQQAGPTQGSTQPQVGDIGLVFVKGVLLHACIVVGRDGHGRWLFAQRNGVSPVFIGNYGFLESQAGGARNVDNIRFVPGI